MAEPRTRDRVWKFALAATLKNDGVARPEEIAEIADVSERTAREALNVIAGMGWIQRDVLPDGSVRFTAPENLLEELEGLQ